ncbi:alpha/beta hydrolase family protein [Candidatus Neomarinimicrobiota bacterium]
MHNKYVIIAFAFFLACENSPTDAGAVKIDIDLDSLFAAPTTAEIAQVEADWQSRDISARNISLLLTDTVAINVEVMILQVISHQVDMSTHVGALFSPLAGLGSNPNILVYLHGGELGTFTFEISTLLSDMDIDLSNTLLVVPSFRGEHFYHESMFYYSSGSESPWDRDVDDALALVNAAIVHHSITGAPIIALLGFSRGAGVGLLMSIRDPRITGLVEFFGPTDFFGSFVREVAQEVFEGNPRNLPGLNYISENFLLPLQNGELEMDEVRLEMVRRSAVLFADQLPMLQIHHGREDSTVYVSQAESLISALEALGDQAPYYEPYLYDIGGHWPWDLAGSLDKAGRFLNNLLSGVAVEPPALPADPPSPGIDLAHSFQD